MVIFMYGNLFLRIAGKPQKLEPAKISCHMVDRPTRLAILHSFIVIQIVSGSTGLEGIFCLFRTIETFNQICIHSIE